MQMKPLLAVLLAVKGSVTGRGSVRGNSKSALLGTALRPYGTRTTCTRLARASSNTEPFFSFLVPPGSSCRAAIKLHQVVNGLRQKCEEADFADGWHARRGLERLRNSFLDIEFRARAASWNRDCRSAAIKSPSFDRF